MLPILAAALCVGGCQNAPGDGAPTLSPSADGTLGRGRFTYAPLSDSDVETTERPIATAGVDAGPAPRLLVARGARFAIHFVSSTRAPAVVEAASPAFFAPDAEGFTAMHHGFGAVLARAGDGNDFVHVEVHEIAALRIIVGSDGDTTLHAGRTLTLRAIASDDARTDLAGSTALAWGVSDPGVATLAPTSAAPGAAQTVTPVRPGSATITASFEGRVSTSVAVEVLP